MRDASCIEFLKWALPQVGLAWLGFRRVHRQVCKRVGKRLGELRLPDSGAYREYLERNSAEWARFASFCRIPISRFFRDRAVFDCLMREILPSLANLAITEGATVLRCWSAGCAAGEEPYSLSVLWICELSAKFPSLSVGILATDVDEHQLERARAGLYRGSSLREVPEPWRKIAFERRGQLCQLKAEFRGLVTFEQQDLFCSLPVGAFDLVLCRNAAFTYFSNERRVELLPRLCGALKPGGALVIGIHERLPTHTDGLVPWFPHLGIFRKATAPAPEASEELHCCLSEPGARLSTASRPGPDGATAWPPQVARPCVALITGIAPERDVAVQLTPRNGQRRSSSRVQSDIPARPSIVSI